MRLVETFEVRRSRPTGGSAARRLGKFHISTANRMAFRWHSPLVSQATTPGQVSSKAPPPPPPEVQYDPAQQRAVRGAHTAACEAIECFAVPDASGKVNNPATIIRAVEAAGMRLGPQGAGTLLAFADAGRSPCGKQGLCGRPGRPKRLIGRGWPELGAACSTI